MEVTIIIIIIKIFVAIRCIYSGYVAVHAIISIGYYLNDMPINEYDINIDYWNNMQIGYFKYLFKFLTWKKIDIFNKEYRELMKQYI